MLNYHYSLLPRRGYVLGAFVCQFVCVHDYSRSNDQVFTGKIKKKYNFGKNSDYIQDTKINK